jgi:tetratricopeptide (TPR) repeat protein
MRVLAWVPLTATLLLSWTVPAVHALPTEILIPQKSAQDYIDQGTVLYASLDNQGAIKAYTKAISLDPKNAKAYMGRAYARSLQGANDDFTQVIRLIDKPDDADAYVMRADARKMLKDYMGAIKDYTQAIRLKPNDADAYDARARTRDAPAVADCMGAIEDYTQVIRLNPKKATGGYFDRALARESLEDYMGAIEDYTQAIRIEPDYIPAYYSRGYARSHLKNYKGASKDFQRTADLSLEQGFMNYYQDAINAQKLLRETRP